MIVGQVFDRSGQDATLSYSSWRTDDQISDLSHIFHRVKRTPSRPNTLSLYAAIRHVFNWPGWYVADDNSADVQLVPRLLHLVQVAGQDTRLKPKLAVVNFAQSIIKRREPA